MPTSPLGQVIRSRREELGLTRDQLVDRVDGLSLSTLIRIELRGGVPRAITLANIAAALDLSLDELMTETAIPA